MRVLGLTDYFGQFLSPQWNTGKFSADAAESSAQDPLCFFAVGRKRSGGKERESCLGED